MNLGKFILAIFVLTAPAWAQYSRADMTKLAADRFDTAASTLNLTPDQAAVIKPILHSKCVDMGQIKDVYRATAKTDTTKSSRKDAQTSLKAINDKYNARIVAVLTADQAKAWKRLQKDWKDDLMVPKT